MGEGGVERVPASVLRGGAAASLALVALIGWLSWSVRPLTLPARTAEPLLATPALRAAQANQLRFEPNLGQAPREVRYLSQGPGHRLSIFDDGMALSVPDKASAQLRFLNARRGGPFEEREPVGAQSNYLRGADPSRWVRGVHQVRQLRYAELYRGIDLVYYSRDGDFEFDLVVQPGADPAQIRLQASGAKSPFIDADGNLRLDGEGGVLRVKRPVLHQHIDGRRVTLDARWVLGEGGALRFDLPAYDERYPLVIDPVFKLLYSTYLGGVHDDLAGAMVLDAQGNAYLIGNSGSEDWPVSGNAYQTRRKNLGVYVRNVVVTKFDAAGTLLWSTFLGGSVNDYGSAIAIDAVGQVVIAGTTNSADFPTTAGAFQNTLRGGTNGFVAVLSPDGSALVQSTLYGGTGTAGVSDLALDGAGNVVIAGNAGPGLATTTGAYKTTLATGTAAYVARFSPSTGGPLQLLAATYYGTDTPENNSGVTGNINHAMALDGSGAPWIAGQAYTTRLPTTANALQTAPTEIDLECRVNVSPLHSFGYVARLSPDLKTLPFASYLSGKQRVPGQQICDEFALAIKVDPAGDVYVHGASGSDKFPTTAGTPQPEYPGNNGFTGYSAYVTKIKGDVPRVLWSTYLGGTGGNTFAGQTLDVGSGSLWIALLTGGGGNFPITPDALQTTYGGGVFDAALVQLDTGTGALKYSSFMGGTGDDIGVAVAVDGGGNAFVVGHTTSRNFPVTQTAFQREYTPNAFDGSDWFFRIIGTGTIGSVRPAVGGTAGSVRLQLAGAGLRSDSAVQLVGPSTLAATGVSASDDGANLGASFDLGNATPGSYALRVRNPDGTEFTKNAAFTVEAGGQPKIWANVLGRPKVRTGVPSTFTVNYGNAGTVDAYLVPLVIRFPANMAFTFPDGMYVPGDTSRSDDVSQESAIAGNGYQHVTILVTSLPAGETRSIALQLTSAEPGPFWVDAYTLRPYETSPATLLALLDGVIANPSFNTTQCLGGDTARPYVRNCLAAMLTEQTDSAYNLIVGLGSKGTIEESVWRRELQTRFATDLRTALLTVTGRAAPLGAGTHSRARRMSAASEGSRSGRLDFWDFVKTASEENPLFGWAVKSGEAGAKKNNPAYPVLPPGAKITWELVRACECPPKPKKALIRLGYRVGKNGAFVALGDPFLVGCKGSKPIVPLSAQVPREQALGLPAAIAGLARTTARPSTALLAALGRERPLATGSACPPPPPPPDEDACPSDEESGGNSDGDGGGSCSDGGGAIDPNDKSGPGGDGSPAHYLRAPQRLAYTVAFENLASASLAAAEVFVTDQLDTSKYDLSTLTLGSISWGPHRIDVPPGLSSYSTVYNIDATVSVRVAGSLNPTTGVLKWTFTTLDPATKLPPSDPTLGFLPPNVNGTQGQGYVNFTIAPKAGLPEGTKWENFASIVFDTNAPIVTPTWVNTLDTTPPVGRVASATQKSDSTDVDVAWSGTDAGAGVSRYTVYVSDNGGAYSAWQTGVAATTAVFAGTLGHAYGFYVIATDGAGNTEVAKSVAEASVTVGDPAAGGGGGRGWGCTIGGPGQRDVSLVLLALAALVLPLRRRVSRRAEASSRHRAPR